MPKNIKKTTNNKSEKIQQVDKEVLEMYEKKPYLNTEHISEAAKTGDISNINLEKYQTLINNTQTSFEAINPQDEFESILTTHIIALHNVSMNCFSVGRNMPLQAAQIRQQEISLGIKASNALNTCIETFNKHRTKDNINQIRVNSMHINDGSQAIVGNIKK